MKMKERNRSPVQLTFTQLRVCFWGGGGPPLCGWLILGATEDRLLAVIGALALSESDSHTTYFQLLMKLTPAMFSLQTLLRP